jgi:hypothetical protein
MEINKLKILELFSGTASFSNVAKEKGHEVFTIDNEAKFNPSLCIDIMQVTPELILEKFGKPDIIWASPPCTKFSVMTIYRNWKKNKDGTYAPQNQQTIDSINLVKHTLDLIKILNPKFWIIENPRAMLRKQPFMPNDKRKTVTYCQYGLEYQKATDLWNNIDNWIPKPMCSPKAPCHVRAPRGSRYGIQGVDGLRKNRNQKHLDISRIRDYGKNRPSLHPKDLYASMEFNWDGSARVRRGIIPKELCEEIIKSCEQSSN